MQHHLLDFKKMLFYYFSQLGLTKGDNVFIHSSMIPIYYHLVNTRINDKQGILQSLYDVTRTSIDDGVLACLAATWEVISKNQVFYNEMNVSIDIGEFSEFLRNEADSVRTQHPVFSIIFNCRDKNSEFKSKKIIEHRFAYGPMSPWQSMLDCSFKILIFGLPGIEKLTLMHHVEQLCGVPYVYNKIVGINGTSFYAMSVPYKNMDIEYSDQKKIEKELLSRGILKKVITPIGPMHLMDMCSAAECIQSMLNSDFYALLSHPPKYISEFPPLI